MKTLRKDNVQKQWGTLHKTNYYFPAPVCRLTLSCFALLFLLIQELYNYIPDMSKDGVLYYNWTAIHMKTGNKPASSDYIQTPQSLEICLKQNPIAACH